MNPYDFVRIDWNRPPDRRQPAWHHRLVGQGDQKLYSGSIEVDVYTETPLFISDPRAIPQDPTKPARSIKNKQGEYIIPGSSLKGMLRTIVESLGNGCLTLFDGQYERGKVNYRPETPAAFQKCGTNTQLCIACRIFGSLRERTRGVFLGKINIGDAIVDAGRVYEYKKPFYTKPLMEPKPHHASFYLDEPGTHIAGRKFYFHHSPDIEPLTERGPIYFGGKPANRYILPLDYDTRFHFRIDFTNLESDEFAALLLAIVLEENMRHKIGYAKPLGLGSVQLAPTSMTLVDYSTRYTQTGKDRGQKVLQGKDMWSVLNEHINEFYDQYLVQIAMEDLRRIWGWPVASDADYYYPSKRDWFDTADSRGKRIADTRNVP